MYRNLKILSSSSRVLSFLSLIFIGLSSCEQENNRNTQLLSGASQTENYLPLLEGKTVGLVANHSSLIGNTHLADTLLSLGIDIKTVFAPEHGFRGQQDAGAHIADGIDLVSGLPVVSLYGLNRKPTLLQLDSIDVLLFDLQDVGVRFYTYISTLTYVMEAAAEKGIPLIVLDRPNPNGFYIDGPVLEKEFTSFVGMHQVPIVYGMTIGEYGMMVNGEFWLEDSLQCDYKVISLNNYDRSQLYELPVKPSPNLPSWQSVYLYPSLCLFEGTIVSIGRGTENPFTMYGHPDIKTGSYVFTPSSRPGATKPRLEGQNCYGQNLLGRANNYREVEDHFNLDWLIYAYEMIGGDTDFFLPYFNTLAGNSILKQQIIEGVEQAEIRQSWLADLKKFKDIRKEYLMYEDVH